MSVRAVLVPVASQKRRPTKFKLVGLLAALCFLPLGSKRCCAHWLVQGLALLLPKRVCAHWLVQAVCRRLRISKFEALPNADPFVRLSGQGKAFKKLYEITDLITDARNSGFVHACRARRGPQGNLAVKMVPRNQHPLLLPRPTSEGKLGKFSRRPSKQPIVETEDFLQYMRTLQKLDHANVVGYKTFFADETYYYFVMERCPGLPMPDYVVTKDLWVETEVRSLQQQLLHALAYVHGMGIIHRDVKIENLIVSSEGCLKLLDFGLGCCATGAAGEAGTEGYTAPEVFSRSCYGPGIDVFSAGACLHVLLSGKPPFPVCERIEDRVQQIVLGARLDAPAFKLVSPVCIRHLTSLLDPFPRRRPSAEQALKHPWFDKVGLDRSGRRLWSAAESDIEFLKVMGAWSGSFSRRKGSGLGVELLLARIAEDDIEHIASRKSGS